MKRKCISAMGIALIFVSLSSIPSYGGIGLDVKQIWLDFLNKLVPPDWDPIGKHVFRPIERAIPNLTLRGFLRNRVTLPLHRRPQDDNILSSGNATYSVQEIMWLAEIEARYSFTEDINLVGIIHQYYNSAFDWDSRFRKNFIKSKDDENFEYYTQADRILREFYLDITKRHWSLRLGKQIVIWGRVDGAKIMDIINPEDFRMGLNNFGDDWEFFDIPTWMLNFKYEWSDYNVQFLWIPDYEFSESSRPFTPYEFQQRPKPPPFIRLNFLSAERPSDFNLAESEWGFRFGFLKRGWDVHLSYFYTFQYLPSVLTEGTIVSFPGPFGPKGPPQIDMLLRFHYPRIHQFGANFEKSVYWLRFQKQVVFRGEALYTMDQNFEDASEARFNQDPRIPPIFRLNGVSKKDIFLIAAPIIESTIYTDWFLSYRLDNRIILNYDSDLRELPVGRKLDRWQVSHTFSVQKFFYKDRASILAWVAYIQDDNDWWWRGFLDYQFTDKVIGRIAISATSGDSDGIFGQFEKRSNIEFGIKYSF